MFLCILGIKQWMAVLGDRRRSSVEMTNHTTIQYSGISEFLINGTLRIKTPSINPELLLTIYNTIIK